MTSLCDTSDDCNSVKGLPKKFGNVWDRFYGFVS